jgi:hypothetical protein
MLHKLTPPFLATWLHDKSEKTQSPGPFFLTGTKVEIKPILRLQAARLLSPWLCARGKTRDWETHNDSNLEERK